MAPRTALLSVVVFAVALAMLSACGGSDDEVAAGSGVGGSGGQSSGGAAGLSGVAGGSQGGLGGAGGMAGVGAAGAAGTPAVGGSGGTAGAGTGGGGTGGGTTVLPGPDIKVMTFNIRVGTANDGADSWSPDRKHLVYDVFKQRDADFVGVQEAKPFQLQDIDAAVSGYKHIGVLSHAGGEICALYYKPSRFTLKKSDTFWLSTTPEKVGSSSWGSKLPRVVTWGRFVEKKTGYVFYVYNTHFDHVSQNAREQSAVLLSKRIDKEVDNHPFVVTGDLNAGESNLVIRYLKGKAKIDGFDNPRPMRDSFRVDNPDATDVGTAHGFSGKTTGAKIDYVFISKGQQVKNAYIDHYHVGARYPSDHFPVIGRMLFPDQ